MTGAEWISDAIREGPRGGNLPNIIVVIYAFISIIGFFTYGFKGIGKIRRDLPALALQRESVRPSCSFAITAIYVIRAAMFSVG